MYKLEITATAKIQLKQIEKTYEQNAINNAFREIKEDPFVGKPLSRGLSRSSTAAKKASISIWRTILLFIINVIYNS